MNTRFILLTVLILFFAVPSYSQDTMLRVTDDENLCAVFPDGSEKVLLNYFKVLDLDGIMPIYPVLCGNVVFYAKQESKPSWWPCKLFWGAVDLNGNSLSLIDKQKYGIAVDWDGTGEPILPEVSQSILLIPVDAEGNIGVHWVVTDFTGKVLVPGDFCGQTHEEEMIALWEETGNGNRVCFYNVDTKQVVNTLQGVSFNSMSGGYSHFRDGLLLVRNEEFNLGVVDKYGKTVIPFIYDDGGSYDSEKGCFILWRGNVRYYVDKTGKETVIRDDEF